MDVAEVDQSTDIPVGKESINWVASVPFILVHLLPFAAIWTGFSWFDVTVCVALYVIRMFFITAAYHRYFAHRSYHLGRVMQFLFAAGGTTAVQKGPLWWAAHHRHHHKHSDTDLDVHSPLKGIWWSHVGWIVCDRYDETQTKLIQDFHKYPELRWLNKYHLVPAMLLALACYLVGGLSCLFIGFFASTAILYHGTFCVNSAAHIVGARRFATTDTSRNSLLVALITCGEGWHNNHHHCPSTACQGFYWWEIDFSYYVLRALSWVGLASDLRMPTERQMHSNRLADGQVDLGVFLAKQRSKAMTVEDFKRITADYYDRQKAAIGTFLTTVKQDADKLVEAKAAKESGRQDAHKAHAGYDFAEMKKNFMTRGERFLETAQKQTLWFRTQWLAHAETLESNVAADELHSTTVRDHIAHAGEQARETIHAITADLNKALDHASEEFDAIVKGLEVAPAAA